MSNSFSALNEEEDEEDRCGKRPEELMLKELQHLKLNYFSLSNLGDFMFKSTERLKGSGTEPNIFEYHFQVKLMISKVVMRASRLLEYPVWIIIGDEDVVVLLKSLTHMWGLDVKVITPFPFLFNTGVPWVLVYPDWTFQVDSGMEDGDSLASDFQCSFKIH
ncbi:hypothetical protein Tco_0996663 [Tanacetum coccineum]